MSLAEQLRARREAGLRPGETVVVDRSGRRFREVRSTTSADDGESALTTSLLVPVSTTGAGDASGSEAEGFFIEAPPHPELYEVGAGSRLYIGAQEAATNREGLKANNVRHILNVATGIPNAFPEDYTYLTVSMRDDEQTQLRPNLAQCFRFIDEAIATGGGVLVHCNAGVSRSASVIIAYLMHKHKLTYRLAYDRLKCAKPDINPNPNFRRQLEALEDELALDTP